MEVPLIFVPAVSLLMPTDLMLPQGAHIFVHSPKFENEDFTFMEEVAPTVIADGT